MSMPADLPEVFDPVTHGERAAAEYRERRGLYPDLHGASRRSSTRLCPAVTSRPSLSTHARRRSTASPGRPVGGRIPGQPTWRRPFGPTKFRTIANAPTIKWHRHSPPSASRAPPAVDLCSRHLATPLAGGNRLLGLTGQPGCVGMVPECATGRPHPASQISSHSAVSRPPGSTRLPGIPMRQGLYPYSRFRAT